jgi:hypothetical protein
MGTILLHRRTSLCTGRRSIKRTGKRCRQRMEWYKDAAAVLTFPTHLTKLLA